MLTLKCEGVEVPCAKYSRIHTQARGHVLSSFIQGGVQFNIQSHSTPTPTETHTHWSMSAFVGEKGVNISCFSNQITHRGKVGRDGVGWRGEGGGGRGRGC